MTGLMQETFAQISQLSEEKQNTLALYLQKHIDEILQKAEQEIVEKTYTIDNVNGETLQAIQNIEKNKNLTICENKNDLYEKLGI